MTHNQQSQLLQTPGMQHNTKQAGHAYYQSDLALCSRQAATHTPQSMHMRTYIKLRKKAVNVKI